MSRPRRKSEPANNQEISLLQDVRNCDMELVAGSLSAVRLGLQLPSIFRQGGTFFWASGWAEPSQGAAQRRRGGRRGGGAPPPQRILCSCWAGEGLWACQKGQIGQKMVRFGQLGAARSRQDRGGLVCCFACEQIITGREFTRRCRHNTK
jgi:hypothetical protein